MSHVNNQKHLFARLLSAIACSVALLLLAVPESPLLARLDAMWYDALVQYRAKSRPGDESIIIVDIDDYSLQAMAPVVGRWSWPRATHAELADWLATQGAAAIVFDIWFSEADIQRPDDDTYFGEVLSRRDNVYLPTLILNTDNPASAPRLESYPPSVPVQRQPDADPDARASLLLPAMGRAEDWHLGAVNFLADADGIARHYEMWRDINGWRIESMPLVLARRFGYALPEERLWRLSWRGGEKPYHTVSYADVWQKIMDGSADPQFAGKVVFIGSTAAGLHDLRPTPMGSQYPGLWMLANAYDNLRHGERLHTAEWLPLIIGLPALLWLWHRLQAGVALPGLVLRVLLVMVLLFVASAGMVTQSWLIPAVTPSLALLLLLGTGSVLKYGEERAARQQAIDLFGRFLDPVVVRQLAADGLDDAGMLARDCEITVLFSDIRGFTSMSEHTPAPEIMALLNDYFRRQVAVIFRHHGTLDKFIGDAIMAFWGAPLDDPQHAVHAVAAALDMADELDRFRAERQLDGFDIGIGIHTGRATVGMLGSEQRLDYTAIGDTVNLGSRLEGVTKGVARILVSDATRMACGDVFDFIPHGDFKVKGREEAVRVYEPKRKTV